MDVFIANVGSQPDAAEAIRCGFDALPEPSEAHAEKLEDEKVHYSWTLTSLLVRTDGTAGFGHIGVCRLYRLRDGVLSQLTTDHRLSDSEYFQCLEDRYLGLHCEDGPDVECVDARAGDRFLLCSPGVWTTVSSESLASVLCTDKPPDDKARSMVQAAEGHVDATCVVVEVDHHP